MDEPSEKSQQRVQKLVDSFTEKSGTHTHPEPETTEAVMLGLAQHLDQLQADRCVPAVSIRTRRKRLSIARGCVPARICRSTSTVTVCSLLQKRACRLRSIYLKNTKGVRFTDWSKILRQIKDVRCGTRPQSAKRSAATDRRKEIDRHMHTQREGRSHSLSDRPSLCV